MVMYATDLCCSRVVCILVYDGVYWCILLYTGVYWCILVYTGVYWCILVCAGVYWYALVCTAKGLHSTIAIITAAQTRHGVRCRRCGTD